MLENRHIRAGLARAVGAAGIEVLAPARVAAVDVTPAAARVTLEDGRVLTAPLVVGAEGRGSVVRQAAGIGAIGWDYGQAGRGGHGRPGARPRGRRLRALPARRALRHPAAHRRRASLVWTESAGRGAALKDARPGGLRGASAAAIRRLPRPGRGRGPALRLSPVPAAGRAPVGAARGPAGRRRPRHPPHRRPGPEPGPEGRRRPGPGAGRRRAPGRGHRRGDRAGALRPLAERRQHRRGPGHRRLQPPVLQRPPRCCAWRAAPAWPLVNRIGPARRFFMREAGGAVGDLPRLLRGEAL